jgi:hypothetical protein
MKRHIVVPARSLAASVTLPGLRTTRPGAPDYDLRATVIRGHTGPTHPQHCSRPVPRRRSLWSSRDQAHPMACVEERQRPFSATTAPDMARHRHCLGSIQPHRVFKYAPEARIKELKENMASKAATTRMQGLEARGAPSAGAWCVPARSRTASVPTSITSNKPILIQG